MCLWKCMILEEAKITLIQSTLELHCNSVEYLVLILMTEQFGGNWSFFVAALLTA